MSKQINRKQIILYFNLDDIHEKQMYEFLTYINKNKYIKMAIEKQMVGDTND